MGDEFRMFNELRIDRHVFEDVVNAVADIPLQRRGRRPFIFSHRERILFLHTFLAFGLHIAHMLVLPRIKSSSEVNAIAKRIASQYSERLNTIFITRRDESRDDPDGAGFVVDCTVVQSKRPCLPFEEAKVWFSGKHNIYCLKKEVVVNATSGTAAFVESAFPGSIHDLTILRKSATKLVPLTEGSRLLADKGYRGGEADVCSLLVVTEQSGRSLRNRRVIVECFFGRLKRKYATFSGKWVLDEQSFDTFFDIACCFTNADIMYHPLNREEALVHRNIMAHWRFLEEERLRRRTQINVRYRQRQEESFVESVRSLQLPGLWPDLNF